MQLCHSRWTAWIGAVLLAAPFPAATQSRADTVAVITAWLELALRNAESAFYSAGAPDVVREAAAALRPTGKVRERVGSVTVCDASLARGDDNVGVDLEVPLLATTIERPPSARPANPLATITPQGFEMGSTIAHVPVSTGCYMDGQGGGGLLVLTLSDGRSVAIAHDRRLCTIVRMGNEWRGTDCSPIQFM